MRCPKVQSHLSAYLDQELTTQEREAVASHLHHCRDCAAELQALAGTRLLLTQAQRFTAPPGFSQRVLANLSQEAPRPLDHLRGADRFFLTPFLFRFAEAAVLLLMIGLGLLSGQMLTPEAGPSGPGQGMALLSLDLFDPAPPGSLGGAYLAMTEVGHEE